MFPTKTTQGIFKKEKKNITKAILFKMNHPNFHIRKKSRPRQTPLGRLFFEDMATSSFVLWFLQETGGEVLYPFPYLLVKSNPVFLKVASCSVCCAGGGGKLLFNPAWSSLELITRGCWRKSASLQGPRLPGEISAFSMTCYGKYNTRRLLYLRWSDWFWISSLCWNENKRLLQILMGT